jgi:hypothetical protein
MCIVIDTNTLASVFVRSSAKHNEFKPVLDWIEFGRGQIVFGGTRYLQEIKGYHKLFTELRRANKAIPVSNDRVDLETDRVGLLVQDPNFNDQHVVALLIVSGCKLICSDDKKAYPFYTHAKFFDRSRNKPRIYRGSSNQKLLTEKNIAAICRPTIVSTKAQRNWIQRLLRT